MKQEKTLSEVEILQYLYEQGLVDFTGDEEDLTLHSDTTGKGLLNIFRAGYKKGKKDIAKEILDEANKYLKNHGEELEKWSEGNLDIESNQWIRDWIKDYVKIIKQKSGFEELE